MKKVKKGGYLSGSTKTKLVSSSKRKTAKKTQSRNKTSKKSQYSKTQYLFGTKI